MMTQRKLTDSELAARLRQRNRDSSERRRERLALAGHTQLLTWIPASLRERVDAAAAASGLKLSPMVERLLLAGLNATTTPATTRDKPTAPETADMFPAPAGNDTTTRDELMTMNTALGNVADKLSATSYAADAAVDRQDAERGTHRLGGTCGQLPTS